ncbi:MAG: LuxR C-terminal-related transcriptional regulator [Caldilineales bacterium]
MLRTKLYKPVVSQDLIARPRLFAMLDHGRRRPITLVSAPAGYGKTTLVGSWLDARRLPSSWISLDGKDNDLRVFLGYFIEAVKSQYPSSLPRTEMIVSGPVLPAPEIIADCLVGELNALDDECILVLDDLHLLRDLHIHALLDMLLRFPPRSLHLVLITRQDPPLPLGKLRAAGLVVEIRGQELRFTRDETVAFFNLLTEAPLSQEALDALVSQTEGWATGLRLAALTRRYGVQATQDVDGAIPLNRYVIDYLMDEVLERVPPETESFLIRTAILDELSGPLCDAVVGAGQAQATLEWLEASNLFTVAVDAQRQWFRYHHLFGEFLVNRMRQRLSHSEISALHRRASDWLADQKLPEAALHHALAGQDTERAVRLITRNRHHLLNTEQRPTLERWLQMLPPGTVNAHPELLLTQAWIAELGRFDSRMVLECIDRAQALIDAQQAGGDERMAHLQGEIDTLRGLEKSFSANDPVGVITLTSRSLAALPKDWYLARSEAWLHLALAWQMAGDMTQAYETAALARSEDETRGSRPRLRNAGGTAFVQWIAGDLGAVLQSARQMQRGGQAAGLNETLGWSHYFSASAHYQRNELDAAERHASQVLASRYACHPISVVQSTAILALVQQARGRPDEAQAAVDRTFDFLNETRSDALLPLLKAFSVELAAMLGDFSTAAHWATTIGPQIPLRVMGFHYAPQLTAARVLIRTGAPSDLPLAAACIERIERFVMSTHNTWFTIEVLALRALQQAAVGDTSAALQAMERAVTLAQPSGMVRVFADLGQPAARLLEKLAREGVASGYVRYSLLPAIAGHAILNSRSQTGPEARSTLIEPLTPREMEILELLAARLTAKEIASRLFISDRTVKRHTANIYQKLGVNRRASAITAATAAGLLPSR